MSDLLQLAASQPMLLLFAVLAIGWLLGRVHLAGFSLGPAAVLFAGLGASALDARLRLPEELGLFGLCLFVYSIGVASGPGFMAALRGRGIWTSLLTVACIASAAVATRLGAHLFGIDGATSVGLFAGSLTNTPALASAVDFLQAGGGDAHAPVVGYSVAYPIGVLLPLLLLSIAARRAKQGDTAAGTALHSETIRLTKRSGRADELGSSFSAHVRFGRFLRGDHEEVVTGETQLEIGDLVTLVGDTAGLREAEAWLGERMADDIADHRTRLDFRRIFVSQRAVVRRPLADLRLAQRFGASVTRVRRGDADFLADATTELELGDRVRVLAPHDRLDAASRFFGDSYRSLAEVDVLSFALGITLGLLLGMVPIPTPMGDLKLGLAGGPLIVGLLLGRMGRIGSFVWDLPFPASMTLRQLGIVLFLAVVGTRSGASLAETLGAGNAGPLLVIGAIATVASSLPALVIAMAVLKLPMYQAFGVVAGIHTQPAVLAWAASRTASDGPARGYASVFPVATVTKILVAQVLARLVM